MRRKAKKKKRRTGINRYLYSRGKEGKLKYRGRVRGGKVLKKKRKK